MLFVTYDFGQSPGDVISGLSLWHKGFTIDASKFVTQWVSSPLIILTPSGAAICLITIRQSVHVLNFNSVITC
ncbi:hypothetical protein BKM63_21425 [Flavobacterium johnsoniae]|uniref:Uncharacterized protein n=1 Tax=Flavobacterium johnsoniae TaxID=986 RepID=A0A1J7BMS6_FLAJO|nr:hypothetical protein BKM63_21425 [Flavobacterium johnsoniae]